MNILLWIITLLLKLVIGKDFKYHKETIVEFLIYCTRARARSTEGLKTRQWTYKIQVQDNILSRCIYELKNDLLTGTWDPGGFNVISHKPKTDYERGIVDAIKYIYFIRQRKQP